MAQQTINVGAAPNDGTGTPLRTAFQYTNSNFTELYTALGGGSGLPGASGQLIFNNGTSLAGDNELFYNATTNTLTTEKLIVPGNTQVAGSLSNLYVGSILNPTLFANTNTKLVGIGTATPAVPLDVVGAATITGDLTVDTSTLKVDSANDRVGIGTATPAAKLIVRDGANRNLLVASDATQLGSSGIAIGGFTDAAAGYAPLSIISSSTQFGISGTTAMTLNSTGLGVGGSPVSGMLLTVGSTSSVSATANAFQILSNKATFVVTADGATNMAGTTINYSWANGTQGPLIFRNATISNVMTLDASGNVGIGVTPAGTGGCLQLKSGITFPATQVASSDANTLDDYEEGTWTPVVTAGTGTLTSVTGQAGAYTKVGRMVVATCFFTVATNGTGGSFISVAGLPFANGNLANIGVGRVDGTTGELFQGKLNPTAAAINLWKYDNSYPASDGAQFPMTIVYYI